MISTGASCRHSLPCMSALLFPPLILVAGDGAGCAVLVCLCGVCCVHVRGHSQLVFLVRSSAQANPALLPVSDRPGRNIRKCWDVLHSAGGDVFGLLRCTTHNNTGGTHNCNFAHLLQSSLLMFGGYFLVWATMNGLLPVHSLAWLASPWIVGGYLFVMGFGAGTAYVAVLRVNLGNFEPAQRGKVRQQVVVSSQARWLGQCPPRTALAALSLLNSTRWPLRLILCGSCWYFHCWWVEYRYWQVHC